MNLFDKLVNEALLNQPELSALRLVVEKELLHHDILRILSQNNLLKNLTFIGGTCLRSCYGGIRLSEDLDFTGGYDFAPDSLSNISDILQDSISNKYGLDVDIGEPKKDIHNVATWKIKIQTRPKEKHFPAQRINLDICMVPSYDKQAMMLLNPYGVDMGTHGFILQAQSRQEIFSDKLLAFALRPNRIKYRDLWDIIWLHQQGLTPKLELIVPKLEDRRISKSDFVKRFRIRQELVNEDHHLLSKEFENEMKRFLPMKQIQSFLDEGNMWSFITYLINDFSRQIDSI